MMAQLEIEPDTLGNLVANSSAQAMSSGPLEKLRQKSWQLYQDLGLPTNKTEVYRYIKLHYLLHETFVWPQLAQINVEQLKKAILPECVNSCLVFVNGHFSPEYSQTSGLPDRLDILTLDEAMLTYQAFLNNQWTQSVKEETDAFAALNGALHQTGAFLYIPPKSLIDQPIQILHWIDHQQPQVLMPRLHVFVGAQSQVQLITTQASASHFKYFINQVSDFVIEEAAHVTVTQLFCDEHEQSWHLDALRATLKRDSTLKTVCITKGSVTVRTDYRVQIIGENAQVYLNGLNMLEDKKESHTHIFIDHQVPHCKSYQLFKNVLNDNSRASFEGKIMVRQAAQKTEAFQLNNNLILSDQARADSKPNLEIFADDVKASHGATIGQLDVDQLFYMKTRGLTDHESKNLLVFGFCEQIIELIPIESVKNALSARARSYLSKG